MLGREAEMAHLDGTLDAASAGQSAFVSIVGDPGIGKTMIAHQVLDEARSRGALASLGRCREDTAGIAFRPWLQHFRTLTEHPTADDLYGLLSVNIEVVKSIELGESSPALDARMRLFDRVAQALADLANTGPLVLVFEDVHWADSPTLLLLQFIAREIVAMGVVIIVTHRPEQIYAQGRFAKAMRGWESETLHQRVELHGLQEPAIRELVEREAARFASSKIAPALITESGGNPLFIIQSVRHVLEHSTSRAAGSATTPKLPSDVKGVISSRLANLADVTRTALEVAACIGPTFDHAMLTAALHELDANNGETTLAAIDEATAADLVEAETGVATFHFRHALIRESLLSNLEPGPKRLIHGAIVAALESLNTHQIDSCLEELAAHSYQAAISGDAEKAAHYAKALATKAYSTFAFDEAARWFDRAIEALRVHAPADLNRRAELLLGLSQSLSMAGRGQEAIERYSETIEIARSLNHVHLFGFSVIGLSVQWGVNGILREGESRVEALLYEGLERVPADDPILPPLLRGRLAAELSGTRPDLAVAEADRALAAARDQSNPAILASVAMSTRLAKWSPDNLAERLALSELALKSARRANDPLSAVSAGLLRMLDLLESGSVDEAKAASQSIASASAQILTPYYKWQSGVVEAMWLLMQGSFDEAERVAQETLNGGFEHNPIDAGGIFSAFSYSLAWLRGEMAQLEAGMLLAIQQYPVVPGWRAGLALVYAETDRPDLAREQFDQLLASGLDSIPRDGSYLVTAGLLAETATLLENREWAELVYPMIEPFADRLIVIGNGVACHGAVAGYAASLASLLGNDQQASHLFERALMLETRSNSRPLTTRTRAAWARHLIRSGDSRDRVNEVLARAHTDAAALGMKSTLARIEAMRSESTAAAPATERSTEKEKSTEKEPPVGGARFQRAGEYRTIEFGAQEIRLRETKGLAYTEHLLRHPEREFFAMELVGLVHGAAPESGGRSPRPGDAGETLDAQAVSQYRQRIEDARADLLEAEDLNDLGQIQRLREEIEFLADHLGSGLGIGGRSRKAVSDNERARVNVTRAIRSSLRKISDSHPALGRRLVATIKTGSCCSYNPDPDNPITWEF